jgi:hypothetical protein
MTTLGLKRSMPCTDLLTMIEARSTKQRRLGTDRFDHSATSFMVHHQASPATAALEASLSSFLDTDTEDFFDDICDFDAASSYLLGNSLPTFVCKDISFSGKHHSSISAVSWSFSQMSTTSSSA